MIDRHYRLMRRFGDRTIADVAIRGTRARREIGLALSDEAIAARLEREGGAWLLRGRTDGLHTVLLSY